MLIQILKKGVFERRKPMRYFNFKYENTLIYIVDTFHYLGIIYCYTDTFKTACIVLDDNLVILKQNEMDEQTDKYRPRNRYKSSFKHTKSTHT